MGGAVSKEDTASPPAPIPPHPLSLRAAARPAPRRAAARKILDSGAAPCDLAAPSNKCDAAHVDWPRFR